MRMICLAVVACCLALGGSRVYGAGVLDPAFSQADAAQWGANQEKVRREAPSYPIMGNQAIMLAAGTLDGREATVNYLFDREGGLYNIAWYVVTPVDDFESAMDLDRTLEGELRARYGEPSYTFSDGEIAKAGEVKAVPPADRPTMEKFAEYMRTSPAGSGAKKPGGTAAAGDTKPGEDIFSRMPVIFYSRLLFWDAGDKWAYINFLGSTDGTCYQHLQFVSKERTDKDGYSPEFKPFVNSPLDRDQDMVTAIHKAWKAKK